MTITDRARRIKLSSSVKIADKISDLEKRGEKIIRLDLGDPVFGTPENIKAAAIEALNNDQTHYSQSRGNGKLRELLCEKHRRGYSGNLDPAQNILITPGGKQAILYAVLSTVEKGDEVIIPTPGWVSYEEIVKLADGTPIFSPCSKDNDFEVVADDVIAKISDKTKAIILNSPNNPTGKIIKQDALRKIHQICVERDIMLISDEVYDEMIFKNFSCSSALSVCSDLNNVIIINSFSKTYAMTGWRLGYAISNPGIIDAMLKFQQNSITCPTSFIQYGAIEALENGKKIAENYFKIYQENRDLFMEEFRSSGSFRAVPPEGGLYAFVDISRISGDSYTFTSELLEKCGASVIPGGAFGEHVNDYIRVCLAVKTDDIAEFIKRVKKVYN